MLNIGNLKIEHPLILAPMAGITDHPYRIICKKMGAGLVFTEFVSADGIIRENQKTLDMIKFTEEERPIGVQIFGDKPKIVAQSAAYIYKNFKPDLIDINFGCPVPKVTKKGAGSAALKNLSNMRDITQSVIDAVPQIPITVKMRAGWNNDNIISSKAGIMLESIGVKAITLHARTTQQLFTGKANWDYIKELKESVSIPVIGNGDVISFEDYTKIKTYTKCDAVMIGRGALGNPWIFNNIINKLNDKTVPELTLDTIIDTCKEHVHLLIKNKSPKVSINLSKKHLSFYLKGFEGASIYRSEIMKSENTNDILKILENIQSKSKALIC